MKDLKRHVGPEIKAVANLIKREFECKAEKHELDGITGMQGWIIGFVMEHKDEDIFQREVEEQFHIRRSTASVILQLMEKNGLIVRQSVARDARLKKLILTPKAVKIAQDIYQEISQMEAKLVKGISEEDLNVFYAVIEKIKNNLE